MNTHPHPLRSTDRPTDRRRCVGVSPCVCVWRLALLERVDCRTKTLAAACTTVRVWTCPPLGMSRRVGIIVTRWPGRPRSARSKRPTGKTGGRRAREGRRAHASLRREDREAGGVPRPSRPAAASQCRVPGQGARRARPRSCLAPPSPPAPPPPSPSPPPRTATPRAVCGAARLRSAWRARAAELFRRGRRAVPLRTAAGSVRARPVGARLLWPLALSISPPLCLGPSRLVPASCRGRRRGARSRRAPAAARLRQQDTRGGCGCPPAPPEGCGRMALSRASRRPSLAGLSAPSSLQ